MTSSRALIVGLVVLVAIGIGAYIAYDQVLRGDSAPALALPSVAPGTAASNDAGTSSAPAAPAAPSASAATLDGDVNGTWTVTTGSQVGYRVREQLANLPAESDAVGRTDQVSGSITVTSDGTTTTVTDGALTVDTTSITSDRSQRDGRMRSQGLQTDQFPTATFTLTQPVDVPATAVQGTPADITLVGDLTLHGVTKSVSIPAKAQLVGGQIQVAGSVDIALADFAIVAPNVGGFIISIADQGALDFVLVLDKG